MNAINDGGPAFPLPAHIGANGEQPFPIYGMSLRDWFAGMALQGMFANSSMIDTFSHHRMMADESFNVADAMIAASEGKEEK